MSSSDPLNSVSSFNGKGQALWKENMIIFIEGMNYDILRGVKNGSFVTPHQINGVVENKNREIWAKEKISAMMFESKNYYHYHS